MPDDRQFDFFDRFTPRYEDERLLFALDDLRTSPPGTLDVIDVGCGNGSTLAFLADGHPLASVTGVDPAQSYIDQARANIAGTFDVGSILDPALVTKHAGQFDRVVVASVLHHLVGRTRTASRRNASQAIRNCLALLRPAGRLYVFEPITGPRPMNAALFWTKLAGVRIFGNRRVELGASWANIAAPLVSYLNLDELVGMAHEAGAKAVTAKVRSDRRIGPVRRRQVGFIITA